MNLTIAETSVQTWQAVKRHYFILLGGAILAIAVTVAGVGALTMSDSDDPAASILPPAGPALNSGPAAQVTAPATYYLVDSEEAALVWTREINAGVFDNDNGASYFLYPGMPAFDEIEQTLDKPWLNANVIDLRGR
jgi:hypothetical protein